MLPVDIRSDHLAIVLDILAEHVPEAEAWVFGSRAKWLARDTSDLDLCICAAAPIGFARMGALREAFEESDLPYKVDVVDWANTSESFRKIIERDRVVVREGGLGEAVEDVELRDKAVNPTYGTVQLRTVCVKIGSGATPRGGKEAYKGGATSLIRSQNIYNDGFHRDGLVYIDDDQSAELRNVEVKPNDVLLNITGDSVARCCQVAADVLPARVNQHVAIIRPLPDSLDARFLRYVLVSEDYQQRLLALASAGATRPALTKTMIEELDIPSPPLAEQKAIAAVLGALDDKIELNRRMNATLETMARALFQSWFVDFDPVRAKLDARRPAGLDEATAALFPATFQDSPIGPVPKGWKVERFDAHITADRGLSYKGEGLRGDGTGLPMHNLNSVYEGGGYKHEGLKYYAAEYRDKHLLEPGDMIVTNTEQGFDHLLIGHAAIVPRCYGPKGLFSHHIYRVRHKPSSPLSPHYLVELFNNRRWHYWISGFSNGTTINMLPMDALEMPMLVVPPVELVKKFTAIAKSAHLQIEDNKQQSRTLATLRDTLLPKLLSGELRIADAERVAVEAV